MGVFLKLLGLNIGVWTSYMIFGLVDAQGRGYLCSDPSGSVISTDFPSEE